MNDVARGEEAGEEDQGGHDQLPEEGREKEGALRKNGQYFVQGMRSRACTGRVGANAMVPILYSIRLAGLDLLEVPDPAPTSLTL